MNAPKPYHVELVAHDPAWVTIAARESERLHAALGVTLVTVHHIGSTSIPSIRAKPIVDLVPVVRSLAEVDAARAQVEALGYVWWGELGIVGRRYCILTDATTGRRVAQLHVFEDGAAAVLAHLVFRDYLRAHPDEASAYEAEKVRAQAIHPGDVNAYNAVKEPWLRACIARAKHWSDAAR